MEKTFVERSQTRSINDWETGFIRPNWDRRTWTSHHLPIAQRYTAAFESKGHHRPQRDDFSETWGISSVACSTASDGRHISKPIF